MSVEKCPSSGARDPQTAIKRSSSWKLSVDLGHNHSKGVKAITSLVPRLCVIPMWQHHNCATLSY